jgi:hypothetical protein
MIRELDRQAYHADLIRLLNHTVAIVNEVQVTGTAQESGARINTEECGTGCTVKWGHANLILTAKHVIDRADPNEIRIYSTPGGPIRFVGRSDLTPADMAAGEPFKGGAIHRCERRDLAALAVDVADFPTMDFFNLQNSADPAPADKILCCGFPVDHNVRIGTEIKDGRKGALYGLWPTAFSSTVLPAPSEEELKFKYPGFDSPTEFLFPYDCPEMSNHPGGISGSAVWLRNTEKRLIWAPSFKFGGISIACFKKGSVVQALKASEVLAFLAEQFGPT